MADSRTDVTSLGSADEALINLVMARKQDSLTYHQTYFQRVRRWYDLYRGIYTGRTNSFRNSIHIPLIFSIIQADIARKVQTSFGAWPVVEFAGYGPEDQPNAKRNEQLISAQMKDNRSFLKAVDFYLSSDIYGIGIARDGWTNISRQHKWRAKVGNTEVVHSQMATEFDGPDWDVVDVLDFWPQPGKKRIKDCAWVIHRYYMDLDDIIEMQSGPYPMFRPAAVGQLKQAPLGQAGEDAMIERRNVYRSWGEYIARRGEKFAKPIEIVEYWGLVPAEFAPDGYRSRVVTVANGRVVLRSECNPFWHMQKPFHDYCPMPDPHYFHGTGKAEICEKMQAASNRLMNQKLDTMDIFGSPMFKVSRTAGLNGDSLISRPGRLIQLDGPLDQLEPIVPDMAGTQSILQDLGLMWNYMQQGTGIIEDTVMGGAGGSDRQTAREFVGRQENVATRLGLEATLAEQGFIEPLANRMRDLNRQFLTVPHMRKILGSAAVINPVTGLALPQEPFVVDLNDINPDYRARAIGASQMLGKNMRKQDIMALMQASSANPILMQITNWTAFANQLYRTFDFDPVELLVTAVPAVTQQAQQQQMSPEDLLNGVGGPGQAPGLNAVPSAGQGQFVTAPPPMQMVPQIKPSLFGG